MDYLGQIEELLLFANRSLNTVTAYKTYTAPFLRYCDETLHKPPGDVSAAEIRSFLLTLQQERGLSDATFNHAISEIRFLYEAVLDMEWNPKQVPRRRQKFLIPFVPSRETVRTFLSSITDLKHKAVITLLYSSGLRISEACSLKCSDVDHARHRLHIAPSKNGRERYAFLPDEAYDILCAYWRALPPGLKTRDWLFTQQHSVEKPVYPQFTQRFIPKQEALLGWPHRITPHSFRHAYATHSYQDGVPLETLSLLLGHSSADSTRLYLHLAMLAMEGVTSPIQGMGVT